MAKIDWLEPANRFRATPMDLLKQGLERQQWQAVAACYTMLTGEVIQVVKEDPVHKQEEVASVEEPEEYEDDEEDTAAEAGLSLAGPASVDDDEENDLDNDDEEDYDDEDEPRAKNKIMTRTTRVGTEKRKNQFVDNQIDAMDDVKFMPKPDVLRKRVKRHRNAYEKIKVVCSGCGVKEKVDPMLVPRKIDARYTPKYKCNSCSTAGGGD